MSMRLIVRSASAIVGGGFCVVFSADALGQSAALDRSRLGENFWARAAQSDHIMRRLPAEGREIIKVVGRVDCLVPNAARRGEIETQMAWECRDASGRSITGRVSGWSTPEIYQRAR